MPMTLLPDPNVNQITFTSEEFYNRVDVRQTLHAPMNINWHGCAAGNGRRRLFVSLVPADYGSRLPYLDILTFYCKLHKISLFLSTVLLKYLLHYLQFSSRKSPTKLYCELYSTCF